jgi:hypothetical protein
MTDLPLQTYRLLRRVTVRTRPREGAPSIARMGPPREFQGRAVGPNWIEWRRDGDVAGYIRARDVERVRANEVGG